MAGIPDSAALGVDKRILSYGLVAHKGAMGYRERPADLVADAAAIRIGLIIGEQIIGQGDDAAGIENPASTIAVVFGPAVGDREAGDPEAPGNLQSARHIDIM